MASLTTWCSSSPSSIPEEFSDQPKATFWGVPHPHLHRHVCTDKTPYLLQNSFIKADTSDFCFLFWSCLIITFPFMSYNNKRKKKQPLQYIFTILQQRHRQKGLLLSYFRNFTLSRKSSKALDEPGRVGEGCKGTPHYILYRCSSLLSYTHHRQLQPYKF